MFTNLFGFLTFFSIYHTEKMPPCLIFIHYLMDSSIYFWHCLIIHYRMDCSIHVLHWLIIHYRMDCSIHVLHWLIIHYRMDCSIHVLQCLTYPNREIFIFYFYLVCRCRQWEGRSVFHVTLTRTSYFFTDSSTKYIPVNRFTFHKDNLSVL